MNKTRLIYLIIVAALLSSCVMATVEHIQGDHSNDQTLTPQEESQSQMCAVIFMLVMFIVMLLARGGGLREIVFTLIGLAIAGCFLLA